jgi:hypothetical protein
VILWHRSFCVSRQRTELAFQLASCLYISLYRAGWGVLMRAICFLPASCKFWHVSRTQAPLVGDYFNYFFTQAANRVSVPPGKLPLHKQPSHLAKATQPRPSQRSHPSVRAGRGSAQGGQQRSGEGRTWAAAMLLASSL